MGVLSCTNPTQISILRKSKIIHEIYKNRGVKTNVFGLIYLFLSVSMSTSQSIVPETETVAANIPHRKERSKCSPDNLPNFTDPLTYNIWGVNDDFTLKEYTSQYCMFYFLEAIRSYIGSHENNHHWNLVIIIYLNGKNTIMFIWSFKSSRAPYGILVMHKSRLCSHGGMQKCGVDYLDIYSPVVNWVSVRSMLTPITLRNLHTDSIDFVLAYTQADVTSLIFMELLILFRVEGYHPRKWIIRLYKSPHGLQYAVL